MKDSSSQVRRFQDVSAPQEVSDLKLVFGSFFLFAIPVRILNVGKREAVSLTVDGTAMYLRHRPGVYLAVVLSV